jgi:hypothetical protein
LTLIARWIALLVGLAWFGYVIFAAEYLAIVNRHRELPRDNTTYVNLERLVKDVAASHAYASLVAAQTAALDENLARSAAGEFVKNARSAANANVVPALETRFGPILSGASIVDDAVSKPAIDVGMLREGLHSAGDMLQTLVLIVGEGRKAELRNLGLESDVDVRPLIALLAAYGLFVAAVGYVAVVQLRGAGAPGAPAAQPQHALRFTGPTRPLMIGVIAVLLGFVVVLNRERLWDAIPSVSGAEQQIGAEAAYQAYEADDVATALRIARPLAEQGDARAQTLIGLIFHLGREVPRDESEARRWFLRAAEQGDPDAPSYLGRIHYEGRGVPQDYVEAAKWYRLAAERNNPTAQYNLGIMYWNGKGVERDKISAHVWFNLASAGFPETESRRRSSSIRTRDLVGSEMSSNEIAEAQKRAREWKPKQTPQS